jgi:hypothetical protein
MPENTNSPVPQFATAEYVDQTGAATCKACGKVLGSSHYRVNGVVTCPQCAERIKETLPKDSHAAFVRGLTFGLAGAILGLILYVAFALTTGLVIGFVSLAVGYIVGKALVMGSKGQGGRRYQIAAVLLTYMAVSLSAVPIALYQRPADTGVASFDIARVGELALLGLASPFLDLSDPLHGIIGLIILFVGIRIAWRMTAGKSVQIIGPLTAAVPAAPG